MLIWLKKVEHYTRMEKIITKLGDIEVKKNHKKKSHQYNTYFNKNYRY